MIDGSVTEAICRMRKAYDEAHAACIEAGEYEPSARRAGTDVALCNLPVLTSKTAVSHYIACIAWLQGRRLLQPAEIKAHMYTAQMALAGLAPNQCVRVTVAKRKETKNEPKNKKPSKSVR